MLDSFHLSVHRLSRTSGFHPQTQNSLSFINFVENRQLPRVKSMPVAHEH